MKFVEVNNSNKDLAIKLQAILFPSEKSPKQVIRGIKTNNPKNFIAYRYNKPVGIVGYYFEKNLPDHILINWFGVLKEYRNKGIGTKILKQLISICKQRKENYLTTYTDKFENSESVNLYKKLGFDVRDYVNVDDIKKFSNLGVKNNYVICCYKLKKCEDIEFEKLNLKIYEDLMEMKNN